MDSKTKKLIQSHILDYLKLLNPSFTQTKKGIFDCPLKHQHLQDDGNPSCNIFPLNSYRLHCFNPDHGKLGDIFSLVKKIEPDMANLDDDELGEYLITLLNIKTDDKVDKLLSMYHNSGFCLIPLRKQRQGKESKMALQNEWEKTQFRDIHQWKEWLDSDLGVGLNLGPKSGVLIIDIDDPKTYDRIKHLLGDTLVQTTKRGYHYVYTYDTDFDFVNHTDLRNKGYEMELRANNAYIVMAPTSVEGEVRSWNDKKVIPMPEELKKFLLELIEKPKISQEKNNMQDAINKNDLSAGDGLKGWDGQCNDMFIKLGGVLRKKINPDGVKWALYNVNQCLADPMENKAIYSMCREIEKYNQFDKKDLAEKIRKHLNILEQSTARDLRESLKEEKKDVEEALDYLVKEGRVKKFGRLYTLIKKVEWQTDFMSVSKPSNVKVLFFDKYARFEDGSMLVLGARTGHGKTHIAANLLADLVGQGIMPYYACTEAGSKFGKITASLGLKEGDYYYKILSDPSTLELEDNAVTIIDWLKPKNSDYAKTDSIYEQLNDQLKLHGGILIIFAQLRKDGRFFAEDMIDFYAALVAKYNHSKITNGDGSVSWDSENTYWKTEKMRDSKIGNQYITIPTRFEKDTKRIILRG